MLNVWFAFVLILAAVTREAFTCSVAKAGDLWIIRGHRPASLPRAGFVVRGFGCTDALVQLCFSARLCGAWCGREGAGQGWRHAQARAAVGQPGTRQ